MLEKIIKAMVDKGIIPETEEELYAYGMRAAVSLLVTAAFTIVLGLLMHMLWQSILFMAAFSPLRRFSGGYHARTQARCTVLSAATMALCLLVIHFLPESVPLILGLSLGAGAVIFPLAPVEDENKPLSRAECRVYKKRARLIFAGQAAVCLGLLEVVQCIVLEQVLAGGLVLVGKVVQMARK